MSPNIDDTIQYAQNVEDRQAWVFVLRDDTYNVVALMADAKKSGQSIALRAGRCERAPRRGEMVYIWRQDSETYLDSGIYATGHIATDGVVRGTLAPLEAYITASVQMHANGAHKSCNVVAVCITHILSGVDRAALTIEMMRSWIRAPVPHVLRANGHLPLLFGIDNAFDAYLKNKIFAQQHRTKSIQSFMVKKKSRVELHQNATSAVEHAVEQVANNDPVAEEVALAEQAAEQALIAAEEIALAEQAAKIAAEQTIALECNAAVEAVVEAAPPVKVAACKATPPATRQATPMKTAMFIF
jgi:hypothetical protein